MAGFSSPVSDNGKHPRSQLVLSRSSCQLVFSVLVGVSSSDPTRHRVTVLVVVSLGTAKGFRVAVPDRQLEFWVAHAGDIIQFYSEHLSSLFPQCDVSLALQSNWERGDHLPARVQELCTPAHMMADAW